MSAPKIDSVATYVASLTKSFQFVPSAAVPAILDCILASTDLSPLPLFHSLLDTLCDLEKDVSKEEDTKFDSSYSNYILSLATAICYLLKKSRYEHEALQAFIWRGFLPLLKIINPNDCEIFNQIAELLCNAVTDGNMWELMEETLVPFSLRLVGLSIGMLQNEDLAIYRWTRRSFLEVPNSKLSDSELDQEVIQLSGVYLPLPTSCHILTSLLCAALRSHQTVQSPSEMEVINGHGCPEKLARNMLWDLCNMAVCMLSQCMELRSCTIRLILPFIFRAIDVLSSYEVSVNGFTHVLSREYFLRKIWKCCLSLFSLGPLERQDAYHILSLYSSLSFHTKSTEDVNVKNGLEEFDLRAEKTFWAEMRRGLVDKVALVRKQSLHILKVSLGRERPTAVSEFHTNAKNGVTILRDGSLENFGMPSTGQWAEKEANSSAIGKICGLVNPCLYSQQRWVAFLLLYEMLEQYGTHLVEAAWNHQISLLINLHVNHHSSMNPVSREVCEVQMGTLEGIFSWLAVLWERGFCHQNPQVRDLIMQSFLGINWENHGSCVKLVPESFVLGSFIQGLNDAVHHRNFGVKGIYSSKTIEGAITFFRQFSIYLSGSERVAFMCSLASVAKEEPFGRAGLMALAGCISSVACGSNMVRLESPRENLLQNNSANLLDVLRVVIEKSKQHFNPNYRLQVCEQVLEATASIVCACDVPLDLLLHFLSALPREFTDCGGTLRGKIQKWFSRSNTTQCSFDSSSSKMLILQNLSDFPLKFIAHDRKGDAFVSYNDEDLDVWRFEAYRWARMLFLVVTEEDHLEPIFMFLRNYGINICTPILDLEWIPMKFLILILSLVEELQVVLEKVTYYAAVGSNEAEIGITDVLDRISSLPTSAIFEKFAKPFLFILEELVSFAKSACSIFWSWSVIKDTFLPPSIRGKLGGPSQRRLACIATTAVLQAITSMKTVASISSWCAQLEKGVCLDSAYTFLWDFSWKVILSPADDTETGAEILLAAYEALVPALKTLSTANSPSVFDLIATYNIAPVLNGEGKPLLDPLVLNFLQNINNLLALKALVRSRRAVLMNWKWCCLDTLLSIPFHVIEKGLHRRSMLPFFSDATVKIIFYDIIESLENAGESSVLPMLRSVRFVLGLFCSGRTSSIVSSCNGVDTQMMLQLVKSSWILHASCNKRRVAPIAALLSSILHSSVFGDLCMHEATDEGKGPLKWFVEKILDEGGRSPRTIRLAALHLTGLWLLYPKTIKYYIEELKMLSLYGSVAFDEDFEAELADNHDARKEVPLLAQSPGHELAEVFINTEMYARVAVAVLFHKLADLADRFQLAKENEDAHAAHHCGKLFLLELLDSAVNDKDLAKELYKKHSGIHRRKVRAWQMICVLSRFVDEDIVQQVTSSLHACLYRNNFPAVRQFLETFAAQIYLKFPSLVEEQLIPIFNDYNMRPQALSSYVFIAANVILNASEVPVQLRHLDVLLPPIIPFLTSHHHSLRGITQLLVYQVLCKFMPALDPKKSEEVPLERKCFKDLKSYLAKNSDCLRLRASMEGFLNKFDPKTSTTPSGIFSHHDEELEFECVPTSLMERVISFLNDVREDLRYSMANDELTIRKERLTVGETFKNKEGSLKTNEDSLFSGIRGVIPLDFQKKIVLHKHEKQDIDANSFLGKNEFQNQLAEMEKEDRLLNSVFSRSIAMDRIRESQQDFILVASLLDRVPNLAGLARTCEVFKAAGLAVADSSIIHDKQFQLISVTAEKWVPIIEVPVNSMKLFLEKKKRDGFSILGLEQTANSTPLDQFSFPKKAVLVLGREKEGIPVDVIHVLDGCIEIPQLGVIRSLNVHVSGAIALWEYTRQHRSKQPIS